MSLNYYGVIIFTLLLLPRLILIFFPPIRRIHHRVHHQALVLEMIGDTGCSLFGLVNLFDLGYRPYNDILLYVWITLVTLLFIIHYGLYVRYIAKGRKEEYLYDRVLLYSPLYLSKALIYLLSGILLFNPYVIVFSLMYGCSTMFINYKKNFE